MNRKKNNKIIATGISTSLILSNMPYNVFANTEQVEEVMFDNLEIEENVFNEYLTTEDIALGDNYIKKEQSDEAVSNDLESEGVYFDEKLKIKGTDLIKKGGVAETSQVLQVETINKSGVTSMDKENVSIVRTINNYADSFAGGNGTQENPYQISNALELTRLAYLVNEEDLDTTDMYFELTNDIDLKDFDSDNDDINGNWIPIGINSDNCFKGNFNGGNYKISNLNINKEYDYSGLFGITENASIENVQIENFLLNDVESGGLLVGYAYGSINIVNVKGVNNKIINTNRKASYIGGLIGNINYLRYNSIHYVNIENIELEVKIEFVEHYGYHMGGLIGYVYSSNNINIDNIDLNISIDGFGTNVAGLIGNSIISDVDKNKNLNIKNIVINGYISDIENSKAYQACIGGMMACASSSNKDLVFEIENIKIYLDYKTNKDISNFGGLIAQIYNGILNIRNVEIKDINNVNAYDAGGLIGDANSLSVDIDNVSVKMDLFSKSYAGGLMPEISSKDYIYK